MGRIWLEKGTLMFEMSITPALSEGEGDTMDK